MWYFIICKIIHYEVKYFDETYELAQPKYKDLYDLSRLDLG